MFRPLACAALLAATAVIAPPVYAQTATDDLPSAENWWDRVGANFFSDDGLRTLRPQHEILAQWTALSEDDQAAVLERCAILADRAQNTTSTDGVTVPSEQRGSNTELGATASERALHADGAELPADEGTQRADTAPDMAGQAADQTSITGAVGGAEVHSPADGVQPYTGLAGGVTADDAELRPICGVVAGI
ncbi:MAG: hypothetical protein Q7J44_15220 [Pseudotabrizicola sp.]|uniref:hypothetical protein n=1 Tax=Pseudotabrizicola sp. TaxID=2939647 RepID=UPI002721D297|nr:hypothetical protein [Pseudotabrizicola sp.]MDO9639887.1 hypothetical protein [Pseudotabrizicola sp.]